MIKSETWVLVHKCLLDAGQRAAGIPDDTANVPFEMWVKGSLAQDAEIGQTVSVRTATGRIEQGTLEAAQAGYELNYGSYVPEVAYIGAQARQILFGGGNYDE